MPTREADEATRDELADVPSRKEKERRELPRRRSAAMCASVAAWFILNMLIANLNKYLFHRWSFKYPALLTNLHMLASFVLGRIALGLRPQRTKPSAAVLRSVLMLSFVFVISVACGNAALRYIHVSFAQSIGATAPLWTVLLSKCITGQSYGVRSLLLPAVTAADHWILGARRCLYMRLSRSCPLAQELVTMAPPPLRQPQPLARATEGMPTASRRRRRHCSRCGRRHDTDDDGGGQLSLARLRGGTFSHDHTRAQVHPAGHAPVFAGGALAPDVRSHLRGASLHADAAPPRRSASTRSRSSITCPSPRCACLRRAATP